METLQTLGVALGLASLAGLNLYLTVFVTGLAIQQNWINVAQTYPELTVLAHPAILAVAGILYVLEFFADKVPWVDSLWDAVHTIIRPIGGAYLAIKVLGTADPVVDVVAALLAGGAAFAVHSMKAGTRLVANHSPEPFSNIALSVAGDATVIGGLFLIKQDPVLALVVFSVVLLCIAYFGPKLFRAVKVQAWLIWKKLASPAADQLDTELPKLMSHEHEIAFHSMNPERHAVAWAVPCVSTSTRGLPGNLFGMLIATESSAGNLVFCARRRWSHVATAIPLDRYKVAHEAGFLSENVILYSLEKKPKYVFVFARSQRPIVKALVASLQDRLSALPAPAVAVSDTSEPAAV